MRYEDENIWLTQKMLATLYNVEVHTINEHISKIHTDGELSQEATIRIFRIVQTEGSRQVAREILLSERSFYQKVTYIYAIAPDYDKNANTTHEFFANVQNKMHFAVHGQTAAKVVITAPLGGFLFLYNVSHG
jgi:hypothetical protein